MSRPDPAVAQDLADAAAVHAAREEIVQALGPLAASPLDEPAAAGMRRALERVDSPAVRGAVRRLCGPVGSHPPLLVAAATTSDAADPASPLASPAARSHCLSPVSATGGAA